MNLRHQYDVAVIGAGPAGVAAAAGAADEGGANVLLIDASDRLGGAVTAAMHRSLCGLYAGAPKSPIDTLNGGTQRDIVERMVRIDPQSVQPRRFGKTWVLEFPTTAWLAALAETCAGIDLKLNSKVSAVRREGARITSIQIDGRWIGTNAVVDCTGGGSLLQLAGEDAILPLDPAGEMLGGYSIRFSNLTGDPEMLRLQTVYALTQAANAGTLPPLAKFTTFYPGPGNGEGVCKLAVSPEELRVDQFADRVVEHLRREVPAFRDANVVEQSRGVVRRDGRQLRGRYIVIEEDVLTGRKIGPEAVHAWWPIERWDAKQGPTYAYPPTDEHYDIPDDALRCAAIENLFAAGICVSATTAASASIRASGICLATGDAAGRLASQMG